MARETKTRVVYNTALCDGPAESYPDGTLVHEEDEPFRIQINRVTYTDVFDGRGKNYAASSHTTETLAELTLRQATRLTTALLEDIAFAAEIGEARALTENLRHNNNNA